MEFVPSRDIVGDIGHRQILENVCEKQIEALVSCSRGVDTRTTCNQNFMKKQEQRKKQSKSKEKNLRNYKGKDTNLGNEFLDASIWWEGTSCKLRLRANDGKSVRRLQRGGTHIHEGILPKERKMPL